MPLSINLSHYRKPLLRQMDSSPSPSELIPVEQAARDGEITNYELEPTVLAAAP